MEHRNSGCRGRHVKDATFSRLLSRGPGDPLRMWVGGGSGSPQPFPAHRPRRPVPGGPFSETDQGLEIAPSFAFPERPRTGGAAERSFPHLEEAGHLRQDMRGPGGGRVERSGVRGALHQSVDHGEERPIKSLTCFSGTPDWGSLISSRKERAGRKENPTRVPVRGGKASARKRWAFCRDHPEDRRIHMDPHASRAQCREGRGGSGELTAGEGEELWEPRRKRGFSQGGERDPRIGRALFRPGEGRGKRSKYRRRRWGTSSLGKVSMEAEQVWSLQAAPGRSSVTTTANICGQFYDTHLERVGRPFVAGSSPLTA